MLQTFSNQKSVLIPTSLGYPDSTGRDGELVESRICLNSQWEKEQSDEYSVVLLEWEISRGGARGAAGEWLTLLIPCTHVTERARGAGVLVYCPPRHPHHTVHHESRELAVQTWVTLTARALTNTNNQTSRTSTFFHLHFSKCSKLILSSSIKWEARVSVNNGQFPYITTFTMTL